jgi:CRP-like cAMP-binding protein
VRRIVPRMFMQDEEIFKQNDSSNGIYLILKGKVNITLSTETRVPILTLEE